MLVATLLVPLAMTATGYSATFKDARMKDALEILSATTGYDFVYQSGLLDEVNNTVTGSYTDVSLDRLLNQTLTRQLGLRYTIIDKTISLSRTSTIPQPPGIVSGTIIDEEGLPLAGTTVRVKGASTAVMSDINGDFVIVPDKPDATLLFNYVGMSPLEMKLNETDSSRPFSIIMKRDVNLMDEVVVTGYQAIKRENATGAFQIVTSKDIDARTLYSLRENLEGKVAGLVSNSDDMQIRGVGTLNASRSPLIVVDGLPISGSLDEINTYDIEKVTVLKDAAAAAVYGARASNGVIVVTTKRGSTDRLQVSFNADLNFVERRDYDDTRMLDGSGLIQLEEKNLDWMTGRADTARDLDNYYSRYGNIWNPFNRLYMQHLKGSVTDSEFNTWRDIWSRNNYRKEWQDFMEHTRLQQTYNLSVRNRGKYLGSNLTVNWRGDNTTLKNQFDNNLLLSYIGDLNPAKWIDLQFGIYFKNTRTKSHASDIYFDYEQAGSFANYLSMRDPDGSPARLQAAVYLDEPSLSNPALGLKDEGYVPYDELNKNYSTSRSTYTRSYVHVNIRPTAGLKLSAMGQYEDISERSEKELQSESYAMRHLYNLYTSGGKHLLPDGGKLTTASGEANYYTLRMQANYQKKFNERHDTDILLGYEYRQTFSKSQTGTLFGYDPKTLTNSTGRINFDDLFNASQSDLGSYRLYQADIFQSSEAGRNTWVKHRYMSYYATMHYTYDRRYAVSGSWRIDECDLFGADKKFRRRPLWSAGISWNMQNESFMRGIQWINILKPRFSYGVTGNINAGYSSYLTASIGLNPLSGLKYANVTTPPNDQLRWEKSKTTNIGIDFSMFNYRLNGSIDYYNKQGQDVLSYIDVDPSTGFSQMLNNNAQTRNRGIELQLEGNILNAVSRDNLGINVALTLAYNKNKINRLNYRATSGYSALTTYHEGYPINSLYSFDFDRIETDNDGYQQIFWKKADGTSHDTSLRGTDFKPEDVIFSGGRDPKLSGSFTPTITYRGFSLSAMLVWYTGHYMRTASSLWNYSYSYSYGNNASRDLLDWWNMPEEQRDRLPGNGYMMSKTHVANYEAVYSSANIERADYAKLRNIVLSYQFPSALCRSLRMQQMRLRLQANDLCTWVSNSRGLDPEAVSANGTLGFTKPRSYTIGLYITL